MAVKFKGNGIVWNAKTDSKLCEFEEGAFETEDTEIAERLIELGYEYEGEITPKQEDPPKEDKQGKEKVKKDAGEGKDQA